MAKIDFKGFLPKRKKENRLNQGDFVYCEACNGARSFWGIINSEYGVINIDGASNSCIKGSELYLGETYVYWTITKRVPCEKMKVTLEEVQ